MSNLLSPSGRKVFRRLFESETASSTTPSASSTTASSTTATEGPVCGVQENTVYLNMETVYDQAGSLQAFMNIHGGHFKNVLTMLDSLQNDPFGKFKHSRYKAPTQAIADFEESYENTEKVVDSVIADLKGGMGNLRQHLDFLGQQLDFLEAAKTDPEGTLQLHCAIISYYAFAIDEYQGGFPTEALCEETLSHFFERPQTDILSVTPFDLGNMLCLSDQVIVGLPLSTKRAICRALNKAQYYKNPHLKQLLLAFCHPDVKALSGDFSPNCIYYNKEFNVTAYNVLLKVYSGTILHTKLHNFKPATAITETLIQVHPTLTVLDRINQVNPALAQELLALAPVGSMDSTLPGQTVTTKLPPTEQPTPSKAPSSSNFQSVPPASAPSMPGASYQASPATTKFLEEAINVTNKEFAQLHVDNKDSAPHVKTGKFHEYTAHVWSRVKAATASSQLAFNFRTSVMKSHLAGQASQMGVDPNLAKPESPMKE